MRAGSSHGRLQVNAPPNFYYHYHKREGRFPVALHVLRRLIADRADGRALANILPEGVLA